MLLKFRISLDLLTLQKLFLMHSRSGQSRWGVGGGAVNIF